MDASVPAFTAFLGALRPTPREVSLARAVARAVAATLRRHFRPTAPEEFREDHLIGGSFGKRTVIRPLPAVDLYYLIPGHRCVRGVPPSAAVLDEVAATLTEAGWQLHRLDGWRIGIVAAGIVVAAIPCFGHRGGFLIPGPGGWRQSNPTAEAAALRLADGVSAGRLGDLLALLKAWRLTVATAPPPFALEVLAREFAADALAAPLPRWLSDFMVWARRHTPAEFELPGRLGRLQVDAAWHGQAEAAYWRLVLADRRAAAGEMADATAEWRRLFGPMFPQLIEGEAA